MASTNIIQFNPNAANQLTDADYLNNGQRSAGLGINEPFPHDLANKMFYQWSTVIAALCLAFANKGYDTSDADLNQLATVFGNLLTNNDVESGLISVPYASSIVFDARQSTGFELILRGNVVASNLINLTPGQLLKFSISQDAVGGRSFAWPANMLATTPPDTTPGTTTNYLFLVQMDRAVRPIGLPAVS